jgi:hypothetical protein
MLKWGRNGEAQSEGIDLQNVPRVLGTLPLPRPQYESCALHLCGPAGSVCTSIQRIEWGTKLGRGQAMFLRPPLRRGWPSCTTKALLLVHVS